MTKIIAIILMVLLLAGGIWWWVNRPAAPIPAGDTGSADQALAPDGDTTAAIERELEAAAVADIDAEFNEIDQDIDSL